jgi:hypothetical protein
MDWRDGTVWMRLRVRVFKVQARRKPYPQDTEQRHGFDCTCGLIYVYSGFVAVLEWK